MSGYINYTECVSNHGTDQPENMHKLVEIFSGKPSTRFLFK